MKWKLIPTKNLKPLEYVFPHHLKNLTKMIYKDKVMKYPLVVEDEDNIVLDGSHRYVFLMQQGFKLAPVIEVDYKSYYVTLGTHRIHRLITNTPVNISKTEVQWRGNTGNLFPPRTTRHSFPFLRPVINVDLEELKKVKPVDMSKYIADVDIEEELNHNKKYIKEIEEEIEEIKRLLKEGDRTKKYLEDQIKEMENKK